MSRSHSHTHIWRLVARKSESLYSVLFAVQCDATPFPEAWTLTQAQAQVQANTHTGLLQ